MLDVIMLTLGSASSRCQPGYTIALAAERVWTDRGPDSNSGGIA